MGLRVVAGVLLALSGMVASSCAPGGAPGAGPGSSAPAPESVTVERLVPRIVATHPFDASSFTQGLELEDDGTLLVGTGWEGESRIYRTTLDDVELASSDLDPAWFGEGITRHGDHIWQLTWKQQTAVKRDAGTLQEIGRASYRGEGWGLCSTGEELIMSDGSDQLRRLDPDTFEELGRVRVTLDGAPARQLNELECVDGDVYANLFLSTDIVRIDMPEAGPLLDAAEVAPVAPVTAVIDGAGLPNNARPDPNHVLNGIAHVPGTDRFLLTGKRWPDLYEVELVPAG